PSFQTCLMLGIARLASRETTPQFLLAILAKPTLLVVRHAINHLGCGRRFGRCRRLAIGLLLWAIPSQVSLFTTVEAASGATTSRTSTPSSAASTVSIAATSLASGRL